MRFLIYAIIGILLAMNISCTGDKGGGQTPAPPSPTSGVQVTQLNLSASGNSVPVDGFIVYASTLPGYSQINMTQTDIGHVGSIPFSSVIPGDGVWYVSAMEYDITGISPVSQNEIKIEAKDGKYYQL